MKYSSSVLGQHITNQLQAKNSAPLIVIGSDVFHRKDLAHIECFNFLAALRLSSAVATLGVTSTKDLYEHVPPSALVLPTIGAISLAVLGACFELKKIGGADPLENWVLKHRSAATHPLVTFATLKAQEVKREAGARAEAKRQKQKTSRRRDQAQRLRGDRYIQRHTEKVTNGTP